jgi:hypothetical protein
VPSSPKISSLDVVINGVLDPSLAASIKRAETGLQKFGMSIKAQNAALRSVYSAAFSPPKEMERAMSKMQAFHSELKNISTIASGVGLGSILVQGMDEAVERVKEFGVKLGDAIQKAGQFSRTKEQLAIELGKSSSDPYTEKIIEQLQKYSFQTHLVPDVLIEAFRSTKSSGFTDPETFKHLVEIANISGATVPHGENASTAFLELMDVYNKAAKGGAALEKTLYAFEKRGVALRGIIAREVGLDVPKDVVNLDPDDPRVQDIDTELAKRIKKRSVPFAPIGGAITQLGGPGGKYDVMAQFSKDLLGAESTLQGSVEMLTREIGHALEGPLTQIINKINEYFNWDKFKATQDFLDSFADKTNKAFKPILDQLGNADWSKVMTEWTALINEFGKAIGKSQPLLEAIVKDIPEEIETILKLSRVFVSAGKALEKAFDWLNKIFPDKAAAPDSPAVIDAQKRLDAANRTGTPDEVTKAQDDLIKAQADQSNAADAAAKQLKSLQDASKKLEGNDFYHLGMATDEATAKLLAFAGALDGAGGGDAGVAGLRFGLSSGYGAGSNQALTEYGPGRPEDQPGHPDYDPDSFHHRGHIHGKLFSLSGGDAAMKAAFAEGHYHIKAGETYRSDKDGKLHRWRDTSGARNPSNEDIFVDKPGARVIINYNPVVSALDSSGISEVLRNHISAISDAINRHTGEYYERSAVV